MNENNETPAVGEVPTVPDTAACPPWHNERLGAWFCLFPNEQGGLRLRKVSGKPIAGPIDEEAENILIPRVVQLSAQNQSLRALVGELADGLRMVESVSNLRLNQKEVERQRGSWGIHGDKDEQAIQYRNMGAEADVLEEKAKALIAKAKEAGL